MTRSILGGIAVAVTAALVSTSVIGAPAPSKPGTSPPPPAPTAPAPLPSASPRGSEPSREPVDDKAELARRAAEVTCPPRIAVEHSVKSPPGFRSYSASIRDYSHEICPGSQAVVTSNMTRTVSCYYCDGRGTAVVRMDTSYPAGKSHCERAGAANYATCR